MKEKGAHSSEQKDSREQIAGETQDHKDEIIAALRAEHEWFYSLFKYHPDAIVSITKEGNIRYANKSTELLTGYPLAELKQYSVTNLFADKETVKIERSIKGAMLGIPQYHNASGKRKNGAGFETTITTIPVYHDRSVVGVHCIIRDITARRLAEHALELAQQEYKYLIEHAPLGIFRASTSGAVLSANHEFARISSRNSPEECLEDELNVLDYLIPDFDQQNDFVSVLKKNAFIKDYVIHLTEERKTDIWISMNAMLVDHKDGSDPYIEGMLLDISARKAAEFALQKSERRLKLAMDANHVGLWTWEIESNTFSFNESLVELLGYTKYSSEWDYTIMMDTIHKDERKEMEEAVEEILRGDTDQLKVECRVKTGTGNYHWLYFLGAVSRRRQGEPIQLDGLVLDIHEQKRITEDLLTREKELKEANKTKDKFFSLIAHDLKSPFTGLLGFSEYLYTELDDLSADEIRLFATNINRTAGRLYNLIENLLQWSRIQTKRMQYEPEDFLLLEMVYTILEIQAPNAEKKKITIDNRVGAGSMVHADRNMIETILRNLVSNALKFTEQGGSIEIYSEKREDWLFVSVKDTGIGISPELLTKIFTVDEPTTREGTSHERGTGLGLILCKEFTELHGGRLIVESEEGEGSIFTFSVKLAKEETAGSVD